MDKRLVFSNKRYRLARIIRVNLIHLILYGTAIMMIIPLLWTISTSLKDSTEVYTWPPVWIPASLKWENYSIAWTILPFNKFLLNTLRVTLFGLMGQLASCTFVAYGFARFSFPGKNVLFLVLLSTMMLPSQVTMIPLFIVFQKIGWLDSFRPLIVPQFFGNAFFIFLLRQFFMGIPNELDEAATIDGCGPFAILRRIIVPLSKPALITVGIFVFLNNWNDFMGPLIYLTSQENFTMALGLRFFEYFYGMTPTSTGIARMELLMAASVAVLTPALVLFFVAQRFFTEGMVMTGLKG